MKADVEVAIIGAGFGGLGTAIRLTKAGRPSFVVFEQADEVGGTWRENTYPGCACDVPSHLYSFSFAPNAHWSRRYASQPEILDYLRHCVETYGLRTKIRYNTAIVHTEFSEAAGYWQLTDQAGHQTTARVVVVATGPFNRPRLPSLPGQQTFGGKAFHSSRWDHSVSLKGKRVAVVGTGASAIQLVPEIADMATQLTVYQRTAPYVTPRLDKPISPFWQRLFRHIPRLQQGHRAWIYWSRELTGFSFIGSRTFNKVATQVAKSHREAALTESNLRQKAVPDYTFGCKRVLVSDEYYPALTRPNVDLITTPIDRMTKTGILAKDGQERPFDVIIYCTGFMVADIISDLRIIGRQGVNLFEHWLATGAQAYKGVTVTGFPNLLFLVGPNTGLGHNSIVHIMESQINYLMSYLTLLDTRPHSSFLDVRSAVQAAYNEWIQARLAHTVWATGCRSWFLNKQGRNTTVWPGLAATYRRTTRLIDPADYDVVSPIARRVAV